MRKLILVGLLTAFFTTFALAAPGNQSTGSSNGGQSFAMAA